MKAAIRISPSRSPGVSDTVTAEGNTVVWEDRETGESKRFGFRTVFPPTSGQREIWESVGTRMFEDAVAGVNATVVAYGGRGTGKTSTIVGSPEDPGLLRTMSRCLCDWASTVRPESGTISARIQASMLERFGGKTFDCLGSMLQGRLDPLDVRCNEFRHKAYSEFFADGLSQHTVDDSAMLQRLWDAGHAARSGSYADDARFHDRLAQVTTIYVLTVTQVRRDSDGGLCHRYSTMRFVDLISCDRTRYQSSGSSSGAFKDLCCLQNVISALVENANPERQPHYVPYRDSKLTCLLKESFGGNTPTTFIATVLADGQDAALTALRFAQRAAQVQNAADINEWPVDEIQLAIDRRRRKLDEDVTRLRLEIAARDAASIAVSEEKELEGKPDDQAAASTCAHRGLRAAVLERKLLEMEALSRTPEESLAYTRSIVFAAETRWSRSVVSLSVAAPGDCGEVVP